MIARLSNLLPHYEGMSNRRSPLNEPSAEHDVAGMTAKTDTTFENSGLIS